MLNLLIVLLSWSKDLQLLSKELALSWNGVTLTLPLSVSPVSHRFPVGPTLLFVPYTFLQPKSFCDIWFLSRLPNYLHCSKLPVDPWSHSTSLYLNLADLLVKAAIPQLGCPIRYIAKLRHYRYYTWRRNLSHKSLLTGLFSLCRGPEPFPDTSAVKCSTVFVAEHTAFNSPPTYAG